MSVSAKRLQCKAVFSPMYLVLVKVQSPKEQIYFLEEKKMC